MENITYIIPVHKFNENIKAYLTNALNSLFNVTYNDGDKIIFIGPKNVLNDIKQIDNKCRQETNYIENEETDFFTQINKAAYACLTPYFSILEFDDEYMPKWNELMQAYSANATFLMPLNILVKGDTPMSLGNEIALSPSFAGDKGVGFLDEEALQTNSNFNLTGGLFNTEAFISIGGLKPSLKVAAWYEFMLRASRENYPCYVVPKLLYKHTILRDDSFMTNANSFVSNEEAQWLYKIALQEYFIKEDRKRSFEEENGK